MFLPCVVVYLCAAFSHLPASVGLDKCGPSEALADLEPDRSCEFSLLLVKAVKASCAEFERGRNMQQVRSACPQASRGLSG